MNINNPKISGIVHFWELPNNNFIILNTIYKDSLFKKFLEKSITLRCASKICKFGLTTLFRYRKQDSPKIRVDILLRIICYLNNQEFDLYNVESNITWIGQINSEGIASPKLPFNFNSRNGARFLAAICNEGWISDGLYYSNSQEELRLSVKNDALFIFGGNNSSIKDWVKDKDQYLSFPSIIRDILILITDFRGIKPKNNPVIPRFLFRHKNFIYGWMEQTIADEGHINYYIKKFRRSVVWRRSIDVTKELSNYMFNTTKPMPFKRLDKNIRKIIIDKKCKIIEDEIKMLNRLGVSYNIYNHGLYFTKKGEIRSRWDLHITKKANLIKFARDIFIPYSRKANDFENMLLSFDR